MQVSQVVDSTERLISFIVGHLTVTIAQGNDNLRISQVIVVNHSIS